MQRYTGQSLERIQSAALIANDAIGNFVLSTVVLQKLREAAPEATITLFCGSRAAELSHASHLTDAVVDFHGMDPRQARSLPELAGFDFVMNLESTTASKYLAGMLPAEEGYVCGPCVAPDHRGDWDFPADPQGDLWRDTGWISADLTQRFPFLTTGFIGEIFCRLAYFEGPIPRYAVPTEPSNLNPPDVIFSTSASLPNKLWQHRHWLEVAQRLTTAGKTVALVGAAPKANAQFWRGAELDEQLIASGHVQDLRGKLSLPQVADLLGHSTVLTLDNGIMHLAVAGGRPVIGLFREGIHRLWAPPYPNLHPIVAEPKASVETIPLERVWQTLEMVLE